MPSSCSPTPDAIIEKSKSEVDMGVACIFLRSVSASLHITASTPKELAIKTWNSQWDAILLGALYDCEIGFNFQSDVAPEDFHQAGEFYVMNYAFKGLNSGQTRTLNNRDNDWLKNHYSSAWELMNEDRYQNAIHCLASYRWHSMPRAQLALLWSGIEGLFQIDYELSFRLSLYIAKYLAPRNQAKRRAIFNEVKKLYGLRSKAVHGGKLNSLSDAVKSSVDLLRKLVVKSAEQRMLPDCDKLYL